MAFKLFLQNLFERVGLTEAPLSPPQSAAVSLAEAAQLRPIFARLAAWGVKQVHLAAGAAPDADDLLQAVRLAAQTGMNAAVRGRASEVAAGTLLADMAAAGVSRVEMPLLSATAEVHDSLAGGGDYRCVLRTIDALDNLKLRPVVQIVLTPSTWKTLDRTLDLLDDRRVREVRLFAIVCRDEEPSSWALSTADLMNAAAGIEARTSKDTNLAWYPPLRFDPARTLAEQVRRGPRAMADSVRIEPDGRIFSPFGPPIAGGTIFQNDWKPIARSEVFRALQRHLKAAPRCAGCPGLAACAGGCLRDAENWAEG